jgi:hypothetical protein
MRVSVFKKIGIYSMFCVFVWFPIDAIYCSDVPALGWPAISGLGFSSALTHRCWVSAAPSSLSSHMSSLEKDMCQRQAQIIEERVLKEANDIKTQKCCNLQHFEFRKAKNLPKNASKYLFFSDFRYPQNEGGECSWRRSRATRIPSKELSPSRVKDFWCFSGPAAEGRRLGARLTIERLVTIEGLRQGHGLRRVGRRPDFI